MSDIALDTEDQEAVRGLIDGEHGTISRRIFTSQKIYQREIEDLFTRAWLFVGHASHIPNPGDFFSSRMGSDPVLLTRDQDNEIHVLLNSCRHRGMRVCRYDMGSTLNFTCPYHGWTYSVDGSLVNTPGDLFGVPHVREAYSGRLDKPSWGLVRCPKVRNYRGLIFATWDSTAPEFEEYVGGFHHWLDNLADAFDGREGGTEAFRGVQKWRVRSNWKFVSENFLGDTYHGETTHASVEAVGIGPGGRGHRRHGETYQEGEFTRGRVKTTFRAGHGASDNVDYELAYPRFEETELDEYFAAAWETRRRKLTAEGRKLGGRGPATMFPNMSFSAGFPRTIVVAHPVSATETEMWRWYLVDRDAPDYVRNWLRHYYMRYSGPGGMTEQDDMENWDYATQASRGVVAQRYPYNYQQGLGETVQGVLEESMNSRHPIQGEVNARRFYQRWAEFLDGVPWSSSTEAARESGAERGGSRADG